MKPAGLIRWALPAVVCFAAVGLQNPRAWSQSTTPGKNEVLGVAKPSEERKLSFSNPGVVQNAPVKPDQVVKAGDVVLELEDYIDKKELERLNLEASSNARVEAADADLAVKKSVLKRKTTANQQAKAAGGGDYDAFNVAEIEEAEADVTLREKQLQVAKEEQQQNKIKAEQQAHKVERMQIKSPVDGIVEKIVTNVGEWADPQSKDGAIVVVTNNPLHVMVTGLKTSQVSLLTKGQKLKVRYADDKDTPQAWADAEIIEFAPVADPQSDTRMFKLKMDNPNGRASGQWMVVRLPDNVASSTNEAGGAGNNLAGR